MKYLCVVALSVISALWWFSKSCMCIWEQQVALNFHLVKECQ